MRVWIGEDNERDRSLRSHTVILSKVQVAGYRETHKRPTYVALNEVSCKLAHGCMVYTKHAKTATISCGTSQVTTKQYCKYTTSVDVQKCAIKRLQPHI